MGVNEKRGRARFLWEHCLKHYKGGVVLDLGVGPSANLYGTCLENGYDAQNYYAFDIEPSNLGKAAAYGVKVQLANFEDAVPVDHLKKKVDVVVCTEVLEHLTEAAEDRIVRAIFEVTKLGSGIAITFPEQALAKPFKNSGHIRQPDPDALIAKMPWAKLECCTAMSYHGCDFGSHVLIGKVK